MSNVPMSTADESAPDTRAVWAAQMRATGCEILNLGSLSVVQIEPATLVQPAPPPEPGSELPARGIIYDGLTLRVEGGRGWVGAIPQPSGPWMAHNGFVTTQCDNPTLSVELSGNVRSIAFDQTDKGFLHFEKSTILTPAHGHSSATIQISNIQIARKEQTTRMGMKWERMTGTPADTDMWRAWVTGTNGKLGWLVMAQSAKGIALSFIPDPKGVWDGNPTAEPQKLEFT